MFETFLGLPVHVLVIHAVVAGVPLAGLATIAVAVRAGWRDRFGWLVVMLDAAVTVAVFVARQSGQWLYDRLNAPAVAAHHRQLGLTLIWFMLAVLAASVLLMLTRRLGAVVRPLVAALAVVVAVASIVQVVRVGHSGSSAVWEATISNTR
jgi:hypothetical protein